MNILKKTREKYGPYIRWKKDLIHELEAGSNVIVTEKGPVAVHFADHNPDRIWALILECAVSQKYEIN